MRDIAPDFRFGRIALTTMLRHPLIARAELSGLAGTRGVSLLFSAVNAALADGLVRLADEWRPDLVIHEPLAVAGRLAAARAGVPGCCRKIRCSMDRHWSTPRSAGWTRRATGTGDRTSGGGRDDQHRAAERARGPHRLADVRGPVRRRRTLPDWLSRPADRPRIAVTRSTVPGLAATG